MKRTAKKKRVAKKKTTRKRSRVVVRKRVVKRIIKRKRTPPKKRKRKRTPESMVEYSVNVSYRKSSQHASNAISFQMSVFSKPGRSKDDIIDAITSTIESKGRHAPKGYNVRIVSWKGGEVPHSVPWGSLAIISGEPATRFHVERDRDR